MPSCASGHPREAVRAHAGPRKAPPGPICGPLPPLKLLRKLSLLDQRPAASSGGQSRSQLRLAGLSLPSWLRRLRANAKEAACLCTPPPCLRRSRNLMLCLTAVRVDVEVVDPDVAGAAAGDERELPKLPARCAARVQLEGRTSGEIIEHEDAPVRQRANLVCLDPRLVPLAVDRLDGFGRRLPTDPCRWLDEVNDDPLDLGVRPSRRRVVAASPSRDDRAHEVQVLGHGVAVSGALV